VLVDPYPDLAIPTSKTSCTLISTKINEEHTSVILKKYFTSSIELLGGNTVPINMTNMRGTINKVTSQASPADDWFLLPTLTNHRTAKNPASH
jgi:hypothetical protein